MGSPECVCHFAGAVLVAEESIYSIWTKAVLAAWTLKALVAKAGPVDVVAFSPILAVAFVGTLWPISTNWTFIPAPVITQNRGRFQRVFM